MRIWLIKNGNKDLIELLINPKLKKKSNNYSNNILKTLKNIIIFHLQ